MSAEEKAYEAQAHALEELANDYRDHLVRTTVLIGRLVVAAVTDGLTRELEEEAYVFTMRCLRDANDLLGGQLTDAIRALEADREEWRARDAQG